MGAYINTGNFAFGRVLGSKYIDKTGLIAEINATLNTERYASCVTRCRRFGKSMAANMLVAYYDHSCDSRELFRGLEIEKHPSFEKHLNKYPVIKIDITSFITRFGHDDDIVVKIKKMLMDDVLEAYPDTPVREYDDVMDIMLKITEKTGKQFIMIIDEWDAICREFKNHEKAMDEYVMLLRRLFKGDNSARVFAGVYMTGILPIKKYKTESALNNFREYSMVNPGRIATYFGFIPSEVKSLCEEYAMDYDDMEKWYDGYKIGDVKSIFNPNSVMEAVYNGKCRSYWSKTGSFANVAEYINMNYEGLKDDIVTMLGGGRCKVDCTSFGNDPAIINNKDEVLTVLIHIGYLAYDEDEERCYIPNKEVAGEMESAVKANNWQEVVSAIKQSEDLMESLLDGDADAVAAGVEKVHQENTSILQYNNENALSCVMNLAFYTAKNKYHIIRELPTGKGFADLVFLPRKNVASPAIVVELKWKQGADTAISQIKRKEYPSSLKDFSDEILLVGIDYDKETKKHRCEIEKVIYTKFEDAK